MAFTTLVSTEQLAAHLSDPAWTVFDCRFSLGDPAAGEQAYRAGHIPGALYAHLERDLSGTPTPDSGRHPLPSPERLAERFGQWGVGADTQVVVYDDAGGAFAARLWWLLRWLGHGQVALLDGGLGQWVGEGRPLGTEAPTPVARPFPLRPQPDAWVDVRMLQGELRDGALLVDARAPARFRGEEEPLDPVAGHVPGALNRPFQANLAADGRFLSPAVLREQFQALLGPVQAPRTVHMCGSGVTACHNLLAMEIAGLPGSRLYPGSWSEWIRDPARPVAKD